MLSMKAAEPGPKAWRARLPILVGLAAVAVLVGGLGYWAVRTQLAGAVIAAGMVQVESNRQVIQHPDGGVVGQILARNGDLVAAGETLLVFDDTLFRSELAIIEGQLTELLARKARLQAERDQQQEMAPPEELILAAEVSEEVSEQLQGQIRLFEARRSTLAREAEKLAEQVAQFSAEIEGLDAQLASLEEELTLVSEELADRESLFERGLVPVSQVSGLRRDRARLTGEIGALTARVAQVRGSIAGVEIEIIQLSTRRSEEAITDLRDLEAREIELSERKFALIEQLSRLNVRSPVNGVVFDSQVFALQSVVRPGEPIMYVIPQDQPLVISARVDPIDVDQVFMGQQAMLRFSGLDQRTTPEISGLVTALSADAITDQATGLNYFGVELVPQEEELVHLGDQVLVPGMPVEVFIRTTDRTPLSYLTSPLMDYFNRAMRG
ncbi:MAG: HlyD family type I secretion periplasmic adaptor subunit [Pseudomonadota bacterium]